MNEEFATSPYALLTDSGGGWLCTGSGGYISLTNPSHYLFSTPSDPVSEVTVRFPDRTETLKADPLTVLQAHLSEGFIAIGYLGYELGRYTDTRLPTPLVAGKTDFPEMYFLFFPEVEVETGTDRCLIEPRASRPPGQREAPPQPLSNLTRDQYIRMVERAREYIASGDIYQVNLSQRFTLPFSGDPRLFFSSLHYAQPVPFACVLQFPELAVVSGSMELFLKKSGGRIVTRPIKGTRSRSVEPETDEAQKAELKRSPKERAENLMIVDLMRNDLSKVTRPGSVRVAKLFDVESYATLHQMASTVEGELREGVKTVDIIRAAFPPGSVTGAPKRRALEIIDELEPHTRGPYCGAIGLFYPNGDFTLSVAIRIAAITRGEMTFWVGGGIVWDSEPSAEYEETLLKAEAVRRALGAL
ncbi:MAG: aminodeoxychorismate synthase component I [Candidatus Dadabacteria bacterium]|nr:aminodeoxychorismate synthase component I [Candidatus Dadabacteria bacterium]